MQTYEGMKRQLNMLKMHLSLTFARESFALSLLLK